MSWNKAQEFLANVSAPSDVEKHKILTFYCTSNSVLDHTVCVLPAKGKRRVFFLSSRTLPVAFVHAARGD
jgi:hypothetical protein